jgi:hypothetical protein
LDNFILGKILLNTFFSDTYSWYACTTCECFYALTREERLKDDERYCPFKHSMKNNYMLSKQWQELTALWALFTALYFNQDNPPYITFAQFELAEKFQKELKDAK